MRLLTLISLFVSLATGTLEKYLRERQLKTLSRDFNHSFIIRKSDPNGHRLDNFGRAVAIRPGVAIVGSPELDDNAIATDAGAVFIYIEDEYDWTLIRQIEDGEPGDYFGWSVALHTDNFAVVGACRGNQYGRFSGSAYYFYVETDPYTNQDIPTAIVQSERHGSAFFGFSVGLYEYNSKVRVAVGAYGHRGKGAVFVYTRDSTGHLGSEQILYGTDSSSGDNFGWSVSLYQDLLIVGAPMDSHQGSAFVFKDNGVGSYEVTDKLSQTVIEDDYNNPLYGDLYGMSVVAGDGFIAVAAPHNDVRGTDAGAVYIYTIDSTDTSSSYSFAQTLFAPNQNSYIRFGWALSYDPIHHRLAVGNDFSKAVYQGEAYLFQISATNYLTHETTVYPGNSLEDDVEEEDDANFGYAVSLYGDYLAVGAELGRGTVMQSGDVYFFKAQTPQEAYARQHSSGSDYSSEIEILDMIAIFLFVFIPLVIFPLIYLWRRYQVEGDGEGYLTFVGDEIASYLDDRGFFKRKSASSVDSLKYAEVHDESNHSSHPLTSDYSSSVSPSPPVKDVESMSRGKTDRRPSSDSSSAPSPAPSSASTATIKKPKTKLSSLKSTASTAKGSAYQTSGSASKYAQKGAPHDYL